MVFKSLQFIKEKKKYVGVIKIRNLMHVRVFIEPYREPKMFFGINIGEKLWKVSFKNVEEPEWLFQHSEMSEAFHKTHFNFANLKDAKQYAQAQYQHMLNQVIPNLIEDIQALQL